MPTAIVVIYTPEGFVVASDGMGNDGNGETTLHEQKLFPTEGPSWKLVYGLSGAASLFDDERGVDILKQECQMAAENLNSQNPSDLSHYADDFARIFGENLQKPFSELELPEDQCMTLHFAGYFKDNPAIAKRLVCFGQSGFSVRHREDMMPSHHRGYLHPSQVMFSQLLKPDKDEFTSFKNPALNKLQAGKSLSLPEAVSAAKSYIEACSFEKARRLDPQCQFIGGDICIAAITLGEGFKWLVPPEPQ